MCKRVFFPFFNELSFAKNCNMQFIKEPKKLNSKRKYYPENPKKKKKSVYGVYMYGSMICMYVRT